MWSLKKILVQRKMLVERKILVKQIVYRPKFCYKNIPKKIFGKKMFGLKKNFGPKILILSKKIFWSQKNFRSKKILVRKNFWVQKNFWVPWGIGLSLVLTVGRGGGINFLALDKSTYQILASYFDYNWFKKFVVVVGGA